MPSRQTYRRSRSAPRWVRVSGLRRPSSSAAMKESKVEPSCESASATIEICERASASHHRVAASSQSPRPSEAKIGLSPVAIPRTRRSLTLLCQEQRTISWSERSSAALEQQQRRSCSTLLDGLDVLFSIWD